MVSYSAIIFERHQNEKNRVALVDQNGLRQTTWGTLLDMSLRVASFATEKRLSGVVPVCMERSAEGVATLLGLNLAGLGIAPLSENTPPERIRLIEGETENATWSLSDFESAMQTSPAKLKNSDFIHDPALVIFTSGSTGTPKGVMLSNEVVYKACVRAGERIFCYQPADLALQTSSFSFVALLLDLMAPLYVGATVHLLPEAARKDAALMTNYINAHQITTMFAPPKVLRLLGETPSMRRLLVGGERLSNFAASGYELINGYGMSEMSAVAFYCTVTQPEENTPIGKPDEDFVCYLLDEAGNLADEGEVCVSGAIAMGYYRHPELTEKAFTKNPFCQRKGHEILLHSGDIARRLPDGNLLFLNRKDFMIKINGQRVEPGETEAVIKETCNVKDAVVIGYTEKSGRTYLCAYYESPCELDVELLRRQLAKKLPSYMIPAYWVHFDRFPLNVNGKIDRKALTPLQTAAVQEDYVAPVGDAETKLCRAFAEVLKMNRVGASDDFIALGGDSILAMEVAGKLPCLGLYATDILRERTPQKIAQILGQKDTRVQEKQLETPDFAPLTSSQMGIYLQCMTHPESVMYNLPLRFTFSRSQRSAEQVKTAVDSVISLHPALYSALDAGEEQILMCRKPFPLEGICTAEERKEEYRAEEEAEFVRPFALFQAPLCRAHAVLTETSVHLYFDCHHIVADGTSMSLLAKQLGAAFAGLSSSPEFLDAFCIDAAEKSEVSEKELASSKQYFENLLAGCEIDSNLLFDNKQPNADDITAGKTERNLCLPDISEYLRRQAVTESSFFMGAFGYTLAKMTGQNESLFAVAENGRKDRRTEATVSMFVRTLPMLCRLDETKPASLFLKEVQEQFFQSVQNDAYPFAKIAADNSISADVMFVYQSEMLSDFESPCGKIEVKQLPVKDCFANFALSIWKRGDSYFAKAEYRNTLYQKATVERFFTLFETVLREFAKDTVLKEIPLLSNSDRAVLEKCNQTESDFDDTLTIVELFRRSVKRYPNQTAVVCKEKRYTYLQAEETTNRLSAYIHSLGIGKEQTVSVLIPRNEYMLLASLGVLKAGAVYQPLDPSYPAERLSFMCKDADSKLLIADRELLSLLPEYDGPILCLDEIPNLPDGSYDGAPCADDGFVLLYTSGTTGLPKGCRLLHRNVSAYVHSFNQLFQIDNTCVSGAYASYGFDAHLSEIYPPVSVGGELHIITEDIRLDLPALKNYFEEHGVTNTVMTTQIARQFVTEYPEVQHLRAVLAGGEKLAAVTPPKTYRFVNGYGPTEATVMITSFPVDDVYADIPIGSALPDTKLYVVDPFGRQTPIGVPGELIAFGPQVAAGYLNRPEKTAEVFVKNTFSANPKKNDQNGYKTGDIVRYLENGNLEIIGRRDQQVKIRGFRIELTEVESVIREFPGISDVTVIAVDDASDGKCIHAYIVSPEKVDVEKLNRFIKEKKPPYMVPGATMQIERIPLTPNFKVDKRKLPPITKTAPENEGKNACRQLTALEQSLSDILEGIVGHKRFSVDDDFISAGITSITSIRLAIQIYKRFGLHITSKDILDGGSILSVENSIVSMFMEKQTEQTEEKSLRTRYPLTQSQLGIYTDSLARGMDTYLISMQIELEDAVSVEILKTSIQKAVVAHPSMLCYIYAEENGEVFSHPAPELHFEIEEISVPSLPVEPTHFSFQKAPLFRFRILSHQGKKYLFIEVHHIIADGESLQILLKDIEKAYRGEQLETESFTAFALAEEEEKARAGSEFETAKAYYDSVFRGVSADYLPTADKFEPAAFAEVTYPLEIDRTRVQSFLSACGMSENILFHSVFAITLARFTAHTDALFSTIHNGRGDPKCENLFAMTVKTLPFYIEFAANTSVTDFLHKVDDRLKQLKKYDLYSFADAARNYQISADPMFVYQGDLLKSVPFGKYVPVETAAPSAKSALSLEVFGKDSGFSLHCEYNGGQYSAAWVNGFLEAFHTCAMQMLSCKTLGEIDILSQKALSEFSQFNDTAWKIPYRPAYRLIEEACARHPEKPAVIANGEQISFAELDAMSNDLARKLCALGVPPRSTVAILLGRTKEIYISEVASLKAGSAFLFLSPEYPDERIRFILQDSSAKVIVTTHEYAQKRGELLEKTDLPVLFADDIDRHTQASSLQLEVEPDALAYMIYTSGSTGTPKGVTVTQKGLVNISDPNPKNFETFLYVNDSGVSAAVSAFTFDASIFEGFVALANGSCVCIAGEEEIHDPEKFCNMCLKNKVTSILGTPSFLLNLTDYSGFANLASNLKTVLAGGEEFTSILFHRLYQLNPNLCILNGYGPSEATVTCSCKQLKYGERITIGTPIANTELYCLDAQNHILPMGALGELAVLGDNVGKGYLNRDDLTQKAFLTVKGLPAFKTGDLAVITHEGQIEFHGRVDNQVKIRGLRVELGEIENVLNEVAGMKSSVVVVKGSGENKYLAAYFTAEQKLSAEDIVAVISKKLTQYMIPRVFFQLDSMPMTANGKIDKKALPDILPERQHRKNACPESDTEKFVCGLFGSILSLEEVCTEDNFFEIGGNSLAASRVVMQLKSKGYAVEYQTIFDHQTPKDLAAYLDSLHSKAKSVGSADFSAGNDPTDPALRNVLQYNRLEYADKVERLPLGNVVLTGAVGFLGIHVLWELLHRETGHIYCLVRKGGFPSPETRLDAISFYYFGECLRETYPGRITVLNADITSENLSGVFQGIAFSTVINCAALVKHYAADDSIEFVNVHGVENLIALAKEKRARLIQISTTSVPGVHTEESLKNHIRLHENQIFVADDMNNKYLLSKYHAELCMLNAMKDGLRGKIIRVGNLMGRYRDGEFQINMDSNAFLNALKGFVTLGKSPISHATDPMEFSPIDCTAQAIVALAGTNDMFTVFHANNRFSFDEYQLLSACNRCSLPILPTDDKLYYEEYQRLLGDPSVNRFLSALVTNDRPDLHSIETDNRFTANILYRIGFSWPFMDDSYLDKVIRSLKDIGFFEREPS